jgi:isoleucyl-tRNA synthetase
VNWCFDCQSALAEAEVEYEDRVDVAIDVGFPLVDPDERTKLAARSASMRFRGPAYAVIWTTTPWTIPANQALEVHPDVVYALVTTPQGSLVLAKDLVAASLARYKLPGDVVATAAGRGAREHRVPSSVLRPRVAVYLGDFVTLDQGTASCTARPLTASTTSCPAAATGCATTRSESGAG